MGFPIVPTVAVGVTTLTLILLIILFSCMWKRRESLKRRKKEDFRSYVERVFNDSVKDKDEFSLNEAYRKVSYPDSPETTDISYTLNRSETAAYDEVPLDDITQGKISHGTSYMNGTLPHNSNKTNINLEDRCTIEESASTSPDVESQNQTHDKDTLPLDQPDVLSGPAVADRRKLSPQTSDEVFILPRNEEDERLNNNDTERVNINSMEYSAVNVSFEHGDEGITRL